MLNGICVWHDVFENKRNSILEYYDIRNYLIINSVYCNDYSIWKISFNLLKRFIANIFRMRYQDIHIGIQGIQDFLRGPQWWGKQDLVKLNNCLLSQALKYEPFKEIMHPAGKIKKSTQAFYLLTLNGAIFPKKKKVLCIPCGDSPYGLFRAKSAYLVDTNNKKAVHVKFSYKKCLIAYLEVLKALAQLILQYKSKRSDYINHLSDLGSWEYWKRYYQTPT